MYTKERGKEMENAKSQKQSNKLFKKIARLTHPDINKQPENHELFRKERSRRRERLVYIREISVDLNRS